MEKKCVVCGSPFLVKSITRMERSKTCSVECKYKYLAKIYAGKPRHTEDSKRRISVKNKGDKNGNWIGSRATYSSIHIWVQRNKGVPDTCSECGKKGEKVNMRWNIQWANVDHKYTRELEKWIGLCSKCHAKYDNKTTKS